MHETHLSLSISYCCSRCKTKNETAVIRKMTGKSQEAADRFVQNDVEKILNEAEKNRYRFAKFDCKCSKCGKKEPWSTQVYLKIEVLLTIFITFAMMFTFIIGLLYNDYIPFVCAMGISGAVVGLWLLIKNAHRNTMEKRILKAPTASRPIIQSISVKGAAYRQLSHQLRTKYEEVIDDSENDAESDTPRIIYMYYNLKAIVKATLHYGITIPAKIKEIIPSDPTEINETILYGSDAASFEKFKNDKECCGVVCLFIKNIVESSEKTPERFKENKKLWEKMKNIQDKFADTHTLKNEDVWEILSGDILWLYTYFAGAFSAIKKKAKEVTSFY